MFVVILAVAVVVAVAVATVFNDGDIASLQTEFVEEGGVVFSAGEDAGAPSATIEFNVRCSTYDAQRSMFSDFGDPFFPCCFVD